MRMLGALPLALLAAACGRTPPAPAPDPMIRHIALPDIAAPELPEAPGRAMFYGACSTCHTPRYILDQPPFPRRVWKAEVDKMRAAYGASFPESMSAPIVDYLVAVHGTGDGG